MRKDLIFVMLLVATRFMPLLAGLAPDGQQTTYQSREDAPNEPQKKA